MKRTVTKSDVDFADGAQSHGMSAAIPVGEAPKAKSWSASTLGKVNSALLAGRASDGRAGQSQCGQATKGMWGMSRR